MELNRAQCLVHDDAALVIFRRDHEIPPNVLIERPRSNEVAVVVEGARNRITIHTWLIHQASGEEVEKEIYEVKDLIKEGVADSTIPSGNLAIVDPISVINLDDKAPVEPEVPQIPQIFKDEVKHSFVVLAQVVMLPRDVANLNVEDEVMTCNLTIMQNIRKKDEELIAKHATLIEERTTSIEVIAVVIEEVVIAHAELDNKNGEVISSKRWPKALFTNGSLTTVRIGLGYSTFASWPKEKADSFHKARVLMRKNNLTFLRRKMNMILMAGMRWQMTRQERSQRLWKLAELRKTFKTILPSHEVP
ncbi:hypothetical protein Acr_09g0005520 [Actinidia rufa]|uniref:Uncharacterized protein n=1 Tax=Actinidia rufa TaxID=165716 RepID=A0A7J0F6P5_9ERIC|nr:hypothetical protein Acr_09g0005520 [Actinidia rufa]